MLADQQQPGEREIDEVAQGRAGGVVEDPERVDQSPALERASFLHASVPCPGDREPGLRPGARRCIGPGQGGLRTAPERVDGRGGDRMEPGRCSGERYLESEGEEKEDQEQRQRHPRASVVSFPGQSDCPGGGSWYASLATEV